MIPSLSGVLDLIEEKSIVQRERKPKDVILLGLLLYFKGFSFRKVEDTFSLFEVTVSHVAVWKWVQKFGSIVKSVLFSQNGSLPSVIVVDETCIQIGNKQYYLYAAICPYSRRIIYFDLYSTRNYITTFTFFRQIKRQYGKSPEVVIVDGGPWYREALNRLGIRRQVVSGGIRNYIERWFETLKDRLKDFDIYFPHKKLGTIDILRCRKESLEHVFNWLYAFVYYYNRIRKHTTLDGKSPLKYWREVLS